MSVPPPWSRSPELLLADHAWARRLAQRLVADPSQAEDLAQDTCLRALERPPGAGWPLRSWLGGVLRNLARQGRRQRARRESREHAVARTEAIPSAGDSLARMAVQQDVVRAVLSLVEPYRSTIVLRFYENLPPRVIAGRMGVPVATVKTRLTRGLAQLRSQLDHEHGGDGRAWALFLLPLADRAPLIPLFLAGAIAVNALPKLFAATAAVGIVFWLTSRASLPRPAPEEVAHARAPAELWTPRESLDEPPPTEVRRESVQAAPEPAAEAVAPPAEPDTFTGRVLDPEGVPVAGCELGLRGSNGVRRDAESTSILWNQELALERAPLALSDAAGRFSLVRPEGFGGYVVSQDPRWETVLGGLPGTRESLLVVAPLFRLRGRVTDGTGAPLHEVELVFVVPRERLRLPGLDLESSRNNGWSTYSDANGSFAFERLPSVPGATLHVRCAPFAGHRIEREAWHDDELEIVLAEPEGGWLEGRVESGGGPLAGATVALGYRALECGADGSFRLSLAGLEHERELLAFARGLLPARVSGDENEDGSVRWPSFVRIELAGETLTLAGEVVDEHGAPLARHEVWLQDPSIAYLQGQGFAMTLESLLRGDANMRHGTQTDEQGRFTLAGLEQRNYTLRVIDPATALVLDFGPFAAGTHGLRIERPNEALWTRLRGRVLSRSGSPLAGLGVSIDADAGMIGAHEQYFAFRAHGGRTVTDADGTFELSNVPRRGATLHVRGADIADPERELTADLDPEALEIVVAGSVRLLVRLGRGHARATHFAVLDASGQSVDLTTPTGGGRTTGTAVAFAAGVSPVTRLSDAGVALVLLDHEGQELARVPLTLLGGIVNTIDL